MINVFTNTFDQCNASLQNKTTNNFQIKKNKTYWSQTWNLVYILEALKLYGI